MNVKKMYIPNTQKWIQFSNNVGKSGHNPYIKYAHKQGKQTGGGSLTGSPHQFMTPIGPPQKGEHDDKVTVKLVSPVEQTTNQAKNEVKRGNVKQGLKRKRPQKIASSSRKRSRKQTQKVKKSKKKSSIKRHKKSKKKNIKKLTKRKNKKTLNKEKKNLLKSSFKDIFA